MVSAFEDIIGHAQVIGQLEREVAGPANAYLFSGVASLGKAAVARRFARILLCPQNGSHLEPCSSCRRIESGNHPDLIVIEPQGRTSVGVDQARAVIQQAAMWPVESPLKIFVVEEAGLLTDEAANALLKTLEEPSPTTVFILAVEGEDALPSTVASRCRTVHFGRLSEEEIRAGLIKRGVGADQAAGVALMAGGRPGLAITLASNPEVARFRRRWLDVPSRVSDRPGESFLLAQEMLAAADPLIEDVGGDDGPKDAIERARKRARQTLLVSGLEMLASYYTDAVAVQMGGPVRNRDVPLADLTELAPRRAVRNAELCLDATIDLQANLRPQLLLTNLLTSLGSLERGQ